MRSGSPRPWIVITQDLSVTRSAYPRTDHDSLAYVIATLLWPGSAALYFVSISFTLGSTRTGVIHYTVAGLSPTPSSDETD